MGGKYSSILRSKTVLPHSFRFTFVSIMLTNKKTALIKSYCMMTATMSQTYFLFDEGIPAGPPSHQQEMGHVDEPERSRFRMYGICQSKNALHFSTITLSQAQAVFIRFLFFFVFFLFFCFLEFQYKQNFELRLFHSLPLLFLMEKFCLVVVST